jgi:hypothetical protein
MNTLDRLPTEILLQILENLPAEDILVFSSVGIRVQGAPANY